MTDKPHNHEAYPLHEWEIDEHYQRGNHCILNMLEILTGPKTLYNNQEMRRIFSIDQPLDENTEISEDLYIRLSDDLQNFSLDDRPRLVKLILRIQHLLSNHDSETDRLMWNNITRICRINKIEMMEKTIDFMKMAGVNPAALILCTLLKNESADDNNLETMFNIKRENETSCVSGTVVNIPKYQDENDDVAVRDGFISYQNVIVLREEDDAITISGHYIFMSDLIQSETVKTSCQGRKISDLIELPCPPDVTIGKISNGDMVPNKIIIEMSTEDNSFEIKPVQGILERRGLIEPYLY
jgi:hypothetical protein